MELLSQEIHELLDEIFPDTPPPPETLIERLNDVCETVNDRRCVRLPILFTHVDNENITNMRNNEDRILEDGHTFITCGRLPVSRDKQTWGDVLEEEHAYADTTTDTDITKLPVELTVIEKLSVHTTQFILENCGPIQAWNGQAGVEMLCSADKKKETGDEFYYTDTLVPGKRTSIFQQEKLKCSRPTGTIILHNRGDTCMSGAIDWILTSPTNIARPNVNGTRGLQCFSLLNQSFLARYKLLNPGSRGHHVKSINSKKNKSYTIDSLNSFTKILSVRNTCPIMLPKPEFGTTKVCNIIMDDCTGEKNDVEFQQHESSSNSSGTSARTNLKMCQHMATNFLGPSNIDKPTICLFVNNLKEYLVRGQAALLCGHKNMIINVMAWILETRYSPHATNIKSASQFFNTLFKYQLLTRDNYSECEHFIQHRHMLSDLYSLEEHNLISLKYDYTGNMFRLFGEPETTGISGVDKVAAGQKYTTKYKCVKSTPTKEFGLRRSHLKKKIKSKLTARRSRNESYISYYIKSKQFRNACLKKGLAPITRADL